MVTENLREAIAVSGAAGRGIGDSTCRQNHLVCVQLTAAAQPHSRDSPIRDADGGNCSRDYSDAGFSQCPLERCENIPRAVRLRKDAIAPLRFERNAVPFKESHSVCAVKSRECTVEKAGVSADVCNERIPVTVVGQVAAPLPCDQQLFSETSVLFDERTGCAVLRRTDRGHHTGGAATDHNYVKPIQDFHTPRTPPRWIRAGKRYWRDRRGVYSPQRRSVR